MTLEQAINKKEQEEQQRLQQQQQEEANRKRARKLFDMLDIQNRVCYRIDCTDCIAYSPSQYFSNITLCNVKQGKGAERLEALAQMDRWMKGEDSSSSTNS